MVRKSLTFIKVSLFVVEFLTETNFIFFKCHGFIDKSERDLVLRLETGNYFKFEIELFHLFSNFILIPLIDVLLVDS